MLVAQLVRQFRPPLFVFRVLAVALTLLGLSGSSFAGQLTLAWDAVANATGYKVHVGQSSGVYTTSVDAGNKLSQTVTGLTEGTRYYFAVTAFGPPGTAESGYSNSVSGVVPTTSAPSAAPVASFTASPTSGTAPLLVSLTDTSTGSVTSRSWTLGDGTTSTSQTVTKTYSNPGTYAVTLTVSGSGGTTTATKSINVTSGAPVAGFSATPQQGTAPMAVNFTDTSQGSITAWSWQFGDGGTSTARNPSHTYSAGGTYTVSLTVQGPGGSNQATKSGFIVVAAPLVGGGPSASSSTAGGTASNTTGLVAAYSFEETSGSQVSDASGNANHGSISGATRIAAGRFGRALQFNGKNDWVTVDHSASLNLTKGMTLEAWVYPTASTRTPATILMKEGSGTASYRIYTNFRREGPTSIINIGGASKTLSDQSKLPVNTWSHVAATYDGSTQKLYVNGELVGSRSQTGSIDVSTGKLRIGGNSVWGYYFAGYIDEVRVYNRALTEAEIAADSNTASAGSSSQGNAAGAGSSQGEIVIDNAPVGAADTTRSFTGTWCVSSGSGPYGADSLYSCGSGLDTYRWTPVIATAGTYDVYVRWTQHPNRSTGVPIAVAHAGGTTTRTFNEQSGGGTWVLHGRYSFNAGNAGYVEVSDLNGQAAADVVRFVPATASSPAPAAGEIVIDNAAAGAADATHSFTGTWCVSGAPSPYGANSLYSCGSGLDTYRWTPAISAAGAYDVYVRWTQHPNRSTAVPIAVTHAGGTTTRTFNEQSGGSTWVLHGRYSFNAGSAGYVEVSDTNGQAAADVVRFVPAQ
jgi:PKD repeat protein